MKKIIVILITLTLWGCTKDITKLDTIQIKSEESNDYFKVSIVSEKDKYQTKEDIDIKFIIEYIGNENNYTVGHSKSLVTSELYKDDKVIYSEETDAEYNETIFDVGDLITYQYSLNGTQTIDKIDNEKFEFPQLKDGNYKLMLYFTYITENENKHLITTTIDFSVH